MELEEGLYTYLIGRVSVTDIIGTRIYPVFVPQEVTAPCLVYERMKTTDGEPDLQDDPLTDAQLALTVWGTDYAACKAATTAIRKALGSASRGDLGVGVQSVTRGDQLDVFDANLKISGVRAEYVFTFDDDL